MNNKRNLAPQQEQVLLETLQIRFEKQRERHKALVWDDVYARLQSNNEKLWSLYMMEHSGGAPDIVGYDSASDEYLFCDCSPESPEGRRSLCYDDAALEARKANKPEGSAVGKAAAMGITLLTEEEYRFLQTLGEFDTKTSSWIATPTEIRALGGALFCDCRYQHIFTYHNGAESYYASRGFRGMLRI